MTKRMETPNYIKNLLKPTANKATSRKVWSIDLETVWLPFFTATNAMGDTAIPSDALGAPLRLAYNQDSSVKFSKSGKPIIKVAKDISDNVKMVRENFVISLDGMFALASIKSKVLRAFLSTCSLIFQIGCLPEFLVDLWHHG